MRSKGAIAKAMNYYVYQIPGQLKSECFKSEQSLGEIQDGLRNGEYGLRQVSEQEYLEELEYNSSPVNPWNR